MKAFVDSDDETSKSCTKTDTPAVEATKKVEENEDKNTEELVFSEDYVHVVFAKPTKAPLSFDDIFASQNTGNFIILFLISFINLMFYFQLPQISQNQVTLKNYHLN